MISYGPRRAPRVKATGIAADYTGGAQRRGVIPDAALDSNYTAILSASIFRNQLVNRFQLAQFWSTTLRSPASMSELRVASHPSRVIAGEGLEASVARGAALTADDDPVDSAQIERTEIGQRGSTETVRSGNRHKG